ncbi:VOC family protein [uncultured Flavobacterium sp.]|uniref:VOC family protein n=1 Tax=uncultured Flavobacterium sp. TaxID=165435 RepID=UPI0030ED9EC0|tara:strand:- start:57751 stop:58140 length:390 start_codon:yes stop_codon:yes gene_type:complete
MKLRVARHTNDLDKIKTFYTTVLGFEVLGSFENHDSYDGLFLGKPNLDWHLEFTKSDEIIEFNYNEDDILVFYPETKDKFDSLIQNIQKQNITFIKAKNPYWNENGKMILDPDGYQIVISNIKIERTQI